jgi:O-antigen/teichoic acid export membrane protein
LLTNWALATIFLAGLSVVAKVGLAQVLGANLAVTVAVTGLGLWRVVAGLADRSLNLPGPSANEVMDLAWPLYITALAYVLINNLDLWVVGALHGDESVALYGIALRLMLVVSIPLMVVNAVVPPVISELAARDRLKELEAVLRDFATLAGLPALASAGSILLAAELIIRLAFGAAFAMPEAAAAARLLALGQLFSVWAGSCGLTLMMSGHQKVMMRITLLGAGFTLLATLLLGAAYGIVGVALGAASGQVLQNIMMWCIVRQRVRIWTHFSYARVPSLLAQTWKHARGKL